MRGQKPATITRAFVAQLDGRVSESLNAIFKGEGFDGLIEILRRDAPRLEGVEQFRIAICSRLLDSRKGEIRVLWTNLIAYLGATKVFGGKWEVSLGCHQTLPERPCPACAGSGMDAVKKYSGVEYDAAAQQMETDIQTELARSHRDQKSIGAALSAVRASSDWFRGSAAKTYELTFRLELIELDQKSQMHLPARMTLLHRANVPITKTAPHEPAKILISHESILKPFQRCGACMGFGRQQPA